MQIYKIKNTRLKLESRIFHLHKIFYSALTNQEFSWTGKYVGTLDGGKDLSADSFFTKTDYKGAVKSGDDWTSGWTL